MDDLRRSPAEGLELILLACSASVTSLLLARWMALTTNERCPASGYVQFGLVLFLPVNGHLLMPRLMSEALHLIPKAEIGSHRSCDWIIVHASSLSF